MHCDQARSLPDTPVLYEEGKTPAFKFQVWKGNSRELQLTRKWSKWMNSYLCFRDTVQKQYTSHFTPKHPISQLHLRNSRKLPCLWSLSIRNQSTYHGKKPATLDASQRMIVNSNIRRSVNKYFKSWMRLATCHSILVISSIIWEVWQKD